MALLGIRPSVCSSKKQQILLGRVVAELIGSACVLFLRDEEEQCSATDNGLFSSP
jgi:hypothetical protein